MNAHSPYISETRRRLVNELDTRTDDEKLTAAAVGVIEAQKLRAKMVTEKGLCFAQARFEEAEAELIRLLEDIVDPTLLANALALCSWKEVK